jgi:hypothetical protein
MRGAFAWRISGRWRRSAHTLDGPRSGDALRILEELGRAYRRLTHPADKEAYDLELLGESETADRAPHAALGGRRPDTVADAPSTWPKATAPGTSALVDDDEDYQLKELPEDEGGPAPAASTAPRAAAAPMEQIRVACACGKRLKARPDLAGKTVQCPACRRRLVVPAPEVAASPLEVVCTCGQRYHARPDLAGKTVTCLRCGAPLAVPASSHLTFPGRDG